jgi:hypothetical protein
VKIVSSDHLTKGLPAGAMAGFQSGLFMDRDGVEHVQLDMTDH